MYTCHNCSQATHDAPAGLMRHKGECGCLFCEDCGADIGNTIESDEWNQHQKWVHDSLVHPEKGTPKVLGFTPDWRTL